MLIGDIHSDGRNLQSTGNIVSPINNIKKRQSDHAVILPVATLCKYGSVCVNCGHPGTTGLGASVRFGHIIFIVEHSWLSLLQTRQETKSKSERKICFSKADFRQTSQEIQTTTSVRQANQPAYSV